MTRGHFGSLLLVSVLGSLSLLWAQELEPVKPPITNQNWTNHPAVVEVRSMYSEVEAAVSGQSLNRSSGSRIEDWGTIDYTAWSDKTNRIRKLDDMSGTDDSAYTLSHYYEARGTLRFVFVQAGAANGTEMQYRLYFTVQGKRFWEDVRTVKGPGYTFPASIPEEWLTREPALRMKGLQP